MHSCDPRADGAEMFMRISVLCFLTRIHGVVPSHPKEPTLHPHWNLFEHEKCGLSQADRIIGGRDAALGAYPWIARIGYTYNMSQKPVFRCGAVLVSKRYIVTAAHCVTNLPNRVRVGVIRLGEHNTNTNPDCEDDVCADPHQDFFPKEVIVHKDYGKPRFKNDISLIRLDRQVAFSSYVMPICMIHGVLLTKSYVSESSEVAGWGIYDIDNPKPSVLLQTVKLPVVKNEKCEDAFKFHAKIGRTQMCVGGEVGYDSCGGDSGGPLMKVETLDGSPRYYLLGVVSFGARKCGATAMPGVYTRISEYMNWIMDNMQT
ncbi:serine protease easter-like isoform X1 [Zootermopsis nevadensis]|uniref:serine protease easter-like isoform X1 n=2 Tax=Zootermopsis nevadensis TaxID=136037 RepID=UPI000B8E5BEC|nr:serine protease easter-like isoform X1 [Zootermopsis nevadensis]